MNRKEFRIRANSGKHGNFKVCLNLKSLTEKNHRTSASFPILFFSLLLIGPARIFTAGMSTSLVAVKQRRMKV
jgi:hypothetical protein